MTLKWVKNGQKNMIQLFDFFYYISQCILRFMKRLLLLLFSILSLTLIAQVPQGVGYQGVATDANGIELVNQSISIRASVLSGSATGTIEWEETHATTTDTFGLFTLTIGQGTNTTNGAQTSFADISWGTNTHFLKIKCICRNTGAKIIKYH